jgi:hypothetical protein
MRIVHTDAIVETNHPDYGGDNPVHALLGLLEGVELAAGREAYDPDHLQHLIGVDHLALYGTSWAGVTPAPERQDDKLDFQKQNLSAFTPADVTLVRGRVTAGSWTGPFLRIAYRGGDSELSRRAGGPDRLGDIIGAWVAVGGRASGEPLVLPRHPVTGRYEVELWGYPGHDLAAVVASDPRAAAALARGELVARPDLVPGDATAFERPAIDGAFLDEVAPHDAMHPILPLTVDIGFCDATRSVWDSRDGANHRYAFEMILRGWDHHLSLGASPFPHGGLGVLEYRNLLSNYGRFAARPELGRTLAPWSQDAFGHRDGAGGGGERHEPFFAVDYVDLHVLAGGSAIGLHRHRDNTEAFFAASGRGLMVVGDWCERDSRERCLEVRVLRAGHLALLHGGQLHGVVNLAGEDLTLLTFGGYD